MSGNRPNNSYFLELGGGDGLSIIAPNALKKPRIQTAKARKQVQINVQPSQRPKSSLNKMGGPSTKKNTVNNYNPSVSFWMHD